jgi:hypothetical protein
MTLLNCILKGDLSRFYRVSVLCLTWAVNLVLFPLFAITALFSPYLRNDHSHFIIFRRFPTCIDWLASELIMERVSKADDVQIIISQ